MRQFLGPPRGAPEARHPQLELRRGVPHAVASLHVPDRRVQKEPVGKTRLLAANPEAVYVDSRVTHLTIHDEGQMGLLARAQVDRSAHPPDLTRVHQMRGKQW